MRLRFKRCMLCYKIMGIYDEDKDSFLAMFCCAKCVQECIESRGETLEEVSGK